MDRKVTLVTGAARGQGRAHALAQAQAGSNLVLLDIREPVPEIDYPTGDPDDLLETARLVEDLGREVVTRFADVRSQEELDQATAAGLEKFGRIDAVIANAGVFGIAPFWEIDDQHWNAIIDINLGGVWRTVKTVAPHLMARRSGSIVMTGSANSLEPGNSYAHYTASKHGLVGLMKTVAVELAPYGVRCNALCPGSVDTAMTDWQGAYDLFAGAPGGTREDRNRGGFLFHALRGVGPMEPSAVADAAVWLTSDAARSVTGAAIPVDAGHVLLSGVNPSPHFGPEESS